MSKKQSKSNAVNENEFNVTNQFKNEKQTVQQSLLYSQTTSSLFDFSFSSSLLTKEEEKKTKGKQFKNASSNSNTVLKKDKQAQKLSTTNANIYDKNDYGFTLDKQKQKNVNLQSITFLNTQKSELECEFNSKKKQSQLDFTNIFFSNFQHNPITILETRNLSPLPKKICLKPVNSFNSVKPTQKEKEEKLQEFFITDSAKNAIILNSNKMNPIARTENYGGRRTGGNLNSRDTNWKSRDGRNRNRDMGRKKQRNKYKQDQSVPKLPKGIINIQCTLNNTILTFANLRGKVIGWQSAGTSGFKGARKSTPYAAKTAAKAAAYQAIAKGLTRAKVIVKGGGPGRDNALRGLAEAKLEMTVIRDVTGLPHNGCRPRKKRRV